jgi:hypothetical protein
MSKRKGTKRQIIVYKIPHRNPKQHEPNKKTGCPSEKIAVYDPQVAPVVILPYDMNIF